MRKKYNKNFIKSSVLFVTMLVFAGSSWADDSEPKIVKICVEPKELPAPSPLSLVKTSSPEINLSIKQTVPDLYPAPEVNFTLSIKNNYCHKLILGENIINLGAPGSTTLKTNHLIMENSNSPNENFAIENLKKYGGCEIFVFITFDSLSKIPTVKGGEIKNCPAVNTQPTS